MERARSAEASAALGRGRTTVSCDTKPFQRPRQVKWAVRLPSHAPNWLLACFL